MSTNDKLNELLRNLTSEQQNKYQDRLDEKIQGFQIEALSEIVTAEKESGLVDELRRLQKSPSKNQKRMNEICKELGW